jgi:hypothetical protein
MKTNPLHDVYRRSAPARNALYEAGCRAKECTEDKAGIVWERFVFPSGESGILFSTPHWWDIYVPLSGSVELNVVIDAIKARANAHFVSMIATKQRADD